MKSLCFMMALLGTIVAQAATPAKPKKSVVNPKPLAGLVLVLDAGHGGRDSGSSGVFEGQEVFEAPYTFDQADRIRYFAEQRGATVYMVVAGKAVKNYRNRPANEILEYTTDARFTLDGSRVVSGKIGLRKRVAFANQIDEANPGKKIVFLSIHFDSTKVKNSGAFVIVPHDYKPKIADLMVEALDGLAAKGPIRVAGENGEKWVHVLRDVNTIHEKVLIELGNFQNVRDNWRIRDYSTRNKFAIRIVDGLQKFCTAKKK